MLAFSVRARSQWALLGNETITMVRNNMSGAQETELAQLEEEYRQLQEQVNAQAWELNLLRARFARYETALRGSQVTVYTQDRDLRYTSISNPMLGRAIEDILGRTDAEILSPEAGAAMIAVKRESLRAVKRNGLRSRLKTRPEFVGTICTLSRCVTKSGMSLA